MEFLNDDRHFLLKYTPTAILFLHVLAPFVPSYILLVLNVLHLVSIVVCKQYKLYYIWASFLIFMVGYGISFYDPFTGTVLIAISLLKLFALLNFSRLQMILNASRPLLIGVLVLLLFFYLIFAEMGLSMFQNSLNRFCHFQSDIYPDPIRTNLNCKDNNCPNGQLCLPGQRDDGFAFLNYNDIFHSFLTVFVSTSLEDWTSIMYWTVASESYLAVIFYLFIVIFISFILLKLFVAVITETYDNIRAKERTDEIEEPFKIYKNSKIAKIYQSQFFESFMAAIVSFEIIARIIYSEAMSNTPQWMYPFALEIVFAFIYSCESILLLISIYIPLLYKSKQSMFILLLTIGNLIAIVSFAFPNKIRRFLLVFSLARTPRVIHLMPRIKKLAIVILKSYRQLFSLFLLSLAWILLGTIILNYLFATTVFDPTSDNYTFDFQSFLGAFLGIFQIFVGDGWNNITLNSMYIIKDTNIFNVIALCTLCVMFYIVSHFIISNLLVGVILENFGLTETEKRKRQLKAFFKDEKKNLPVSTTRRLNPYTHYKQTKSSYQSKFLSSQWAVPGIRKELIHGTLINQPVQQVNMHKTLFYFNSTNPIRLFCTELVSHKYFEYCIRIIIVASIVEAAFDTPINRLNASTNFYRYFDLLFISLFSIEFILKIIAMGFIFHSTSYLRNPWNRFDFIILCLQCIGFIADTQDSTGVARVLRVSKAIRVLRIINQFKGIKSIFSFIVLAFSRIVDASLLSLLVFVPFALYGNYVYMDLFNSCNDDKVVNKEQCVGVFNMISQLNISIVVPRVWKNHYSPFFHFDTFGTSLLTMFVLSTSESWTDIFNLANQSTTFNAQPQPNKSINFFALIYFASFMIIGCLIVVDLFAGIIIQNYLNISGQAYLTIEQRQYIDLIKQVKLVKPTVVPARPLGWRSACYDILTHPKYNFIINSLLFATVLVNMVQFTHEPSIITIVREVLTSIFIVLFLIDIMLKYNGYGVRKFKKSLWNSFDLVVILGALLTSVLDFSINNRLVDIGKRVFILLISFKLVQRLELLTLLFKTIIASFNQIVNMLSVFALLLLTFAFLFIEIFGLTRYYQIYNSNANFRDIGSAMLLLMRMITGESWHRVMNDALIDGVYCVQQEDNYLQTDCGSKVWGFLLFLTFYISCTYVFINMFIVIVLENFSYFYSEDVKFSVVRRKDIRLFKQAWSRFDEKGKGYISKQSLIPFLRALRGRLSVKCFGDGLHVQNIANDIRNIIPNQKEWDMETIFRIIERYRFHFDGVSKEDLQARRLRFNRVYMECMMNLNDRGIPFNTVLLVLLNSVVVDQTFLRIDEFIKRKQVLEEIDEKIFFEKATGILKTIIQKRKFLKLKVGTLVSNIPQIVIDDNMETKSRSSNTPTPTPSGSEWSSDSDVEDEHLLEKVKQNQYYKMYQEIKQRTNKL